MYQKTITCLSCPRPLCETGCPCGNAIKDIILLVKQGKEEDAANLLYQTNPFPEWTSLLCDHDRNCRGHCVLGKRGNPFDFPSLEAYLSASFHRPLNCKETNGKSVMVIGAGPAGLSAAYFLAKEGFHVEVYEKEDGIGGVLYTGIPPFRYEKQPLKNIQNDLEKMGIVFHLNQMIDKTNLSEFCKDFSFIVLACGAEKENTLGYEVYDGVVGGLHLLYDLSKKQDPSKYAHVKRAFVWGGGNVAMDCARSLKRLGLDVSLVYRRGEAEMPAAKDEIEACRNEGVSFNLLTNIKEPIIKDNRLVGAKMIRMEIGEKDESGRASFHEIPGSEFEETFDLLVPALGEKIVLPFEVEGLENVYLAGDCRYGAYNIAAAIKDGREVAKTINEKE